MSRPVKLENQHEIVFIISMQSTTYFPDSLNMGAVIKNGGF